MDLKAKSLLKDPALYVALVPVVALASPELGRYLEAHRDALLPLAAVLLGHFGVRMSAVKAAGKQRTITHIASMSKKDGQDA